MDRLPPEPESECWLHPDVQIGPSPIAQLGLFARADIRPDAIVSRLGGHLVTGRELQQIFAEAALRPDHPHVDTITGGEDLHLVLPAGRPNHYGNHSCDPNLWWADAYTLVARRPIGVGEEVASDYATSTGVVGFAMDCACRSGTVPGCHNRRGLAPSRAASPLRRSLDTCVARSHPAVQRGVSSWTRKSPVGMLGFFPRRRALADHRGETR